MLIEQADFNTILITFITSTSALIAILGGFFISRVISLAGEQNSIYIRYKQIENEINTTKTIARDKKIHLEFLVADDFVSENIIPLIGKNRDLKGLIKKYQSRYKHEGIISAELTRLENVKKDYDKHPEIPPVMLPLHINTHDYYLRDMRYPEKKLWYELLYKNFFERSSYLHFNPFESLQLKDRLNKYSQSFIEEDRDYTRDIYKIETLTRELNNQQRLFNMFQTPKEIFIGMLILVYGALVGIIIPFIFLVFGYNGNAAEGLVGLILFSYISFLAILISYLSVSFYKLNTRFDAFFTKKE